jgi:penicillin-binding protein 1A
MRAALKEQPVAANDPPEGMVQTSTNGVTEWVKTEDLERIQSEESYDTGENQTADEAAFDIF